MQISVKDTSAFRMAGLYKAEHVENGNIIIRCAIITTSANPTMSGIHHRMPVILPADIAEVWLDNTIDNISMLKEFLKPYSGNIKFTVVA